jgi:hypothetical protein
LKIIFRDDTVSKLVGPSKDFAISITRITHFYMVQFQMVSMEIFIDVILPISL